jgi:hypothetical protein
MRTRFRFGSQRRRVLLLAWETLLPVTGPLPQISHTLAMIDLLISPVATIRPIDVLTARRWFVVCQGEKAQNGYFTSSINLFQDFYLRLLFDREALE